MQSTEIGRSPDHYPLKIFRRCARAFPSRWAWSGETTRPGEKKKKKKEEENRQGKKKRKERKKEEPTNTSQLYATFLLSRFVFSSYHGGVIHACLRIWRGPRSEIDQSGKRRKRTREGGRGGGKKVGSPLFIACAILALNVFYGRGNNLSGCALAEREGLAGS